MKITFKYGLTILWASMTSFVWAQESQQFERASYSYLGLGLDVVTYEEVDTDLLGTGIELETEMTGTNLAQRSGGYVVVDDAWGFYINTGSSLGATVNDEEWRFNGTLVQENAFTIKRNELLILVTRRLAENHYWLVGGAYNDTAFSRFNFTLPEQDQFNIAAPTGSVSEDVSQILAYAGYEYNQFFTQREQGFVTQFQALVGVPLYSSTLNTDFGDTALTNSFDGYVLRLTPSIGYQLNQNFMVAASFDLFLNQRDEDEGEITAINADGVSEQRKRALPENSLWNLQPAINVYWSF